MAKLPKVKAAFEVVGGDNELKDTKLGVYVMEQKKNVKGTVNIRTGAFLRAKIMNCLA